MNMTTTNNQMQIVAVVFCSIDKDNRLFVQETPYFYLDMLGCVKGDLAFVHNGDNFGIVRVARVLSATDAVAVRYVTKPLLGKVMYEYDVIADASVKLKDYKEATTEHRIEAAIDEKLDNVLYREGRGRKLSSVAQRLYDRKVREREEAERAMISPLDGEIPY